MATAAIPDIRPANPNFSSGPCAKRPGFTLDALAGAFLGRSHRAAEPKARLVEVIDLSQVDPWNSLAIGVSGSSRPPTPAQSRWRSGRCWVLAVSIS